MTDDDLTAALLRAYMSAGPRLEASVLAVARVAIERAAEVAGQWRTIERKDTGMTSNEFATARLTARGIETAIRSLIPPEKEPT